MVKSEGSQHIYNSLKNAVQTPFTKKKDERRVMLELGNIRGLEINEVKNYILIPNRNNDKDGKEVTHSWNVHELSKDCIVTFKINEDEDKWINA